MNFDTLLFRCIDCQKSYTSVFICHKCKYFYCSKCDMIKLDIISHCSNLCFFCYFYSNESLISEYDFL